MVSCGCEVADEEGLLVQIVDCSNGASLSSCAVAYEGV